jgi:hypothetical protein
MGQIYNKERPQLSDYEVAILLYKWWQAIKDFKQGRAFTDLSAH